MIQLIGLRSNCNIKVREILSITSSKIEDRLKQLLKICEEVIIISTCNRTEIYLNSTMENEELIENVFDILNWDMNNKKDTFYIKDQQVVKHIMEVCSGFHSKILGEDQILGQVKNAYEVAMNAKSVKSELQRLFQYAITCGKEFRFKSELYKIPVSSSSIVVKEAMNRGVKNFMIVGFGEVGGLCYKYLKDYNFEKLYVVVRNPYKVNLEDKRVQVISYDDKSKYTEQVECIIACTSAPHIVIYKDEISATKSTLVFDLAIPRDVDEEIALMENVELYDIDKISIMDSENKARRKTVMETNRYIVEEYIREFTEWKKLRELSPYISGMVEVGEDIYKERFNTFLRKKHTKNNDKLAKMLLKSTSDFYVHRAIEVLKEEQLKGSAEECIKIIEKIFLPRS